MKSAALIFGLIAGLLGSAVLVLGNIDASLASAAVLGPDHDTLAKGIAYLVPAIGWLGAGLALGYPRLGGLVLLLSAAAWAAIAFVAGHGVVLFAAAPFTFAAAGGLVALFARRPTKPVPNADVTADVDADGVIYEAVAAAAPPPRRHADAPLPKAVPPRPEPHRSPTGNEGGANVPAPVIPPPFRDIVPDDEPAYPLSTAIEAIPETPAPAAPVDSPTTATQAGEGPATPASPDDEVTVVPGLRPRRPGDWTLPTPATAVPVATPRYAADRQAATPSRIEPLAPATAPDQRPRGVSALDFAPASDFSALGDARPGRDPSMDSAEQRQFGRRSAADDAPAFKPDAPRRRGGVRTVLRLLIALLFILVLLGLAAAVYLDYRRGPQSVLFGHHPHLAGTAAVTPPHPAPATPARAAATLPNAMSAPVARAPTAAAPVRPPVPATTSPATQATPQAAILPPPASTATPAAPASASPAVAAATPSAPPAATPVPLATATPAPPSAAPAPSAAISPASSTAALASFTDPVSYCAAIGTADAPDARYTGPAVPTTVAAALLVPQSTTADQIRWRCANGVAFACNAHQTNACMPTPTVDGMLKYCALHPGATNLPAPNGSWSCTGTRPVIPEDQSWPVDPQGFFPGAWIRVSPVG